MKIALLGYGKMGKRISEIAKTQGHQIVVVINRGDDQSHFGNADVAIDFSTPDAAPILISAALDAGLPVVSGTTGWLSQYDGISSKCLDRNGAFLYASNFSIGVNVFFELNRKLSQMMRNIHGYKVKLTETHHTEKIDAPSGTALSLINDIIVESAYKTWSMDPNNTSLDTVLVEAKREGVVPGIHDIQYKSVIDTISIKHEAHSRDGFAQGALIAAQWIIGKRGLFTMRDVLEGHTMM